MQAQPGNTNGRMVRFGVYEVDLATAELRKQGTLLRLQEQPFQILCALLERPGDVVTREELIGRLWADGTVVDYDRGLNAAVTRLRQVLSDSAESPRYVETVARRGYRFIAPLERTVEGSGSVGAVEQAPPKTSRWLWALAALGVSGLLVGLGLWRANPGTDDGASTNEPVTIAPLTTEPGVETDVSFSPDGNQIAYAWRALGADEPHIYLRQVRVGDPVRLTKGAAGEYSPAWSRDGRYIAFLRPVDAERLALTLAPVLGSGPERKLIELPSPSTRRIKDGGLTRSLDWTPDSRYLIVAAFREGAKPYEAAGLMRVAVDTGEPRWIHEPPAKLTDGSTDAPAVSPDGRTLAFVKAFSGAAREIHLQPLGNDAEPTGPPFPLRTKPWCQSLAWTKDGKSIFFDASRWLYRIEARPGAAVEVLQAAGTGVRMPAVARDGRVAWTREFRDDNIWEVNLASGSFHQVISSTAVDRSAEYSPDGRRIALQTRRTGTGQILVCDSDGKRCTQITEMKGDAGSPSWSPDGSQIAFDAEAGNGHYDIYVVNAAGGAPRRLTTYKADNAGPFWSRDGRWIYFLSARVGKIQTWKIPAGGGSEVLVIAGGGILAQESLDGRHLYFSRTSGGLSPSTKAELFRSNLDGSGETKLVDQIVGRAFTVTRDHLFYLRWEEGSRASLRSYTLATGVDRLIVRTPRQVSNGLSISPDGTTAILTQVDSEGSDIVMVDRFR